MTMTTGARRAASASSSVTAVTEYKTLPFYLAPGDDLEPNCFSGYVASFRSVDSVGDMIMPGAFEDTLPDFLADGFIAWQHDWAQPIGKPIEAREDPQGLFIKARISETRRGRDALTLLRDGVVKKLSIGYKTLQSRPLTPAEGRAILGEEGYEAAIKSLPRGQDAIRGLVKIALYEGSLVSVPANPHAVVTAVKSDDQRMRLRAQARRERIRFLRLEASILGVPWRAHQKGNHACRRPR